MSCVLFLWREEADARINPATLIEFLEDGESFRGLASIPFNEVRTVFRQEFPELRDSGHALAWSSEGERFEACFLMRDERAVSMATIYCSKSPLILKRLRSVAASLGCPPRCGSAAIHVPLSSVASTHSVCPRLPSMLLTRRTVVSQRMLNAQPPSGLANAESVCSFWLESWATPSVLTFRRTRSHSSALRSGNNGSLIVSDLESQLRKCFREHVVFRAWWFIPLFDSGK